MKLRTLSTLALLALAGPRVAPAAIVTVTLPANSKSPKADAINASGQIAGTYYDIDTKQRACLWTPGAAPTYLTHDESAATLQLADDGRLAGRTTSNDSPEGYSWKAGDANAGYTTFDSLVPASSKQSDITKMNAAGRITGYYQDGSTNPNSYKSYTWTKAGGYKALTPNGYFETYAGTLSADNVITGAYKATSAQKSKPCAWLGGAFTFTELPLPVGAIDGFAGAIHDTKGIVGNFSSSNGADHACSWTGADFGTFSDLTPPIDHLESGADGICASGVVLGVYSLAGNGFTTYHYCAWRSATNANSFVSISPEVWSSGGLLNATGRFAGTTYYEYGGPANPGPTRAITWQAGVLTSLLPAGATSSKANGLGDDGTVAGEYVTTGGQTRAFAWKNGAARDITPAGAASASAWVVNATGAIGGVFTGADGKAGLFTATAADGPVISLISGKPAKPISAAPTVAVTGKRKIVTTKASVRLKGTTTGSVTSVAAKIGKKTVQAAGAASWSAKVKLKPGKNKITITATGPGGFSAPAKITITRKTPLP